MPRKAAAHDRCRKGRDDEKGRSTRLGHLLKRLRDRHYRLSEGLNVRVERAGEAH